MVVFYSPYFYIRFVRFVLCTVEAQQCSSGITEYVSTLAGGQPVLKFSVSTTSVPFIQYEIVHNNFSAIVYKIAYYHGVVVEETMYNNWTAGPDADPSRGILDIQLDTVTVASRGNYILINTSLPSNSLRCVNLQVVGRNI